MTLGDFSIAINVLSLVEWAVVIRAKVRVAPRQQLKIEMPDETVYTFDEVVEALAFCKGVDIGRTNSILPDLYKQEKVNEA